MQKKKLIQKPCTRAGLMDDVLLSGQNDLRVILGSSVQGDLTADGLNEFTAGLFDDHIGNFVLGQFAAFLQLDLDQFAGFKTDFHFLDDVFGHTELTNVYGGLQFVSQAL